MPVLKFQHDERFESFHLYIFEKVSLKDLLKLYACVLQVTCLYKKSYMYVPLEMCVSTGRKQYSTWCAQLQLLGEWCWECRAILW